MTDRIIQLLEALPPPLAVFLAAMLPILELRGAIPYARYLELGLAQAYVLAVAGNLLPVPFILWLLGPVTALAERHWPWFHRFLTRIYDWSRRRHTRRFERLRDLALIMFVAIPLPITGAWSGSLAAFVFGVDRRKALLLIAIGVLIAGLVVSGITYGTAAILK